MSYLNALITDLRDRKLWPLVVVLLAATVAVPVLLSKSPAPAPAHPAPSLALPVATAQAGPAVSVSAAPSGNHLGGSGRDPFTQQLLAAAGATSSSATAGAAGGVSVSTGSSVSGGSSATASSNTGVSSGSGSGTTSGSGSTGTGSSGSTGSTGSGSGTPSLPQPTVPKKPVSNGLQPNQAYHVAVSITNPSGGLDAIDPLVRDSVLPTPAHPLLVDLGVLQGARKVLFAVEPGAVLTGPGICTPGPVDCEVLSLVPGQTEGISMATATGSTPVAMFQVTGITVDQYSSAAAAKQARLATVAAGRRLLADASSSVLPLFPFDPALDAIVDQRDLIVGGN